MNYSRTAQNNFLESIKPWIGSFALLPASIYYILNKGQFTFIDYVNLLIHEGGHGVFKIFGKYIYTMGGSLMQIIIPGMFIFFYLIKKNRFGAQFFLIWLGENLFNISVYASDARSQKLPLLGGNRVYHDWHYLLGEIGLLDYDQAVGLFIYSLGVSAFIISFLLPLFVRKEQLAKINLDL